MPLSSIVEEREIRHFHLFCGLGGGAVGFNRGRAQLNGLRARFRCIGGIDVSPAAVRDFERLSGSRGTVLDLFDREQYTAFHGQEPPPSWRECSTDDIQRAAGSERPNIVFLSAPCKGFSGLLSQTRSLTAKYQALNRLTLRGVWLMLEAWADDPPELVIFENVPRIATRGRHLLDQIGSLLRHYGYAVAETFHDCGEIGGLAQSRKRFLLVARHVAKVPPFLYEPPKRPLRAVGEILERFPMPGAAAAGPMHAVPNLQWKTWVRLAFVQAGSDWRSLNKLRVVDGNLADYLLVPDYHRGYLGVNGWHDTAGTIPGRATPSNGKFAVADPRFSAGDYGALGVKRWDDSLGVVTGHRSPGQGPFSVADPRIDGVRHNNVFRIVRWEQTSPSVTGGGHPNSGGICVSDPRPGFPDSTHQNVYRVVAFDQSSKTITGSNHPSGGAACVADPRAGLNNDSGKYKVTRWDGASGTVIGGDDHGAYAVADPRVEHRRSGALGVHRWTEHAGTVAGESLPPNGAFCVADPRLANQRSRGDHYLTNGHYGVVGWGESCGAVSAAGGHDNGRWNVADPRLPEASEKLVAVIRALDGTWHRPFTTLELAALQSLVDPDEIFDLDGSSDSAKRERIGNAVPPAAAQAIADLMGQTLLMAWSGQSFALSAQPIWVQPVAVALSVHQPNPEESR
jgi:site-specific DNA-cytosine methylase